MIYPLTLGQAFALVGALLIALGLAGLVRRESAQAWLQALPRSRAWGFGLLVLATIWFWLLIKIIDLGEFDNWRSRFLLMIPVAAFLTAKFVDELLTARALGMLILLAAEPLLEAAFLQPELSRLFLVSLVYVGIVLAIFWIGMPYLLRDQIAWLNASPARWNAGAIASVAYGAMLVICCLTLHRSS